MTLQNYPNLAAAEAWLLEQFATTDIQIEPLRNDASFRRFFRVKNDNESMIFIDSPPTKESNAAYVNIAKGMLNLGLHVPKIIAADFTQGFFLISDLGDVMYADILSTDNVNELYYKAFAELIKLQFCKDFTEYSLPDYDRELLLQEMQLFIDWYLLQYKKIKLTANDLQKFNETFDFLIAAALQQPQVLVHRDFHSRNLLLQNDRVGIVDFQDARWGPVTYDLVSLLRDCYVEWPKEQVQSWVMEYLALAKEQGLLQDVEPGQFLRWFDLMGVQRHLKVAGIFSRLYLRDGKASYLNNIPLTMRYLSSVIAKYPELTWLTEFLSRL